MAVKKIRKIASWIQMLIVIVSLGVLAVFYFGGSVEDSRFATREPVYMSLLLYWLYVVFALSIILLIVFAVHQFTTSLMAKPKSALGTLGVLGAFIALLGLTYVMGNAVALPGINADFQKFNVPFWLKVTDMWIYTMYILFALCILAVVAGQFKKIFGK